MTSDYNLTEGVLEKIMNGSYVPYPILQILGCKKIVSSNGDRVRLVLSDGKYKINVGIYTVPANNQDTLDPYGVVKLIRYFSNVIKNKEKQDIRVLIILEIEIISGGAAVNQIIGNPVSLADNEFPNSQYCETSNLTGNTVILRRRKNANAPNNDFIGEPKTISLIASLNPFHNNWIIMARVISKTAIRHWSNARGEGKLFSCDLVDKSGEIRCTAFKELVDKFFDILEVDKVYYISNCLLQPINRQFCSLNHHFEMTMTTETKIQESLTDNALIPKVNYNFTTIDKVAAMVAGTVVDVVAVCKSVSEMQTFTAKSSNRELKKKDVLLVDQSKTGIFLTLWGTNAESFKYSGNPVISVKNVKIYEYRGIKSITPVMSSLLKVNPDIPETCKLRNWYDSEGNQIEFNNVSARTNVGNVPWMTFKEAQRRGQDQGDQGFYFQTYGTILLIRVDRAVYKSCPNQQCQKKVIDLENGMYRCEKCNREYPDFKYRFLVSMNVSDSSGSQWVTVFSAEAEQILGKTAHDIGEAMEHDQESVGKLFEEMQFKQFVFKIRAKMDSYNDEQRLRMIVVGIKPLSFEDHNAYLIKRIEELCGIIS